MKNILAENMRRFGTKNLTEQVNNMINDVKKFCSDNQFKSNLNGNGFSKQFKQYNITIIIYQYETKPDHDRVALCISSKNSSRCDIDDSSFTNATWNFETFSSKLDQYMN